MTRDLDSSIPPRWRRYLRFWRPDVQADVSEEIAFHMEGLVAEFVARGMPVDEARRLAARRFGDADDIARSMRALAVQRESAIRRADWLDALGRDLAFARRQLGKRLGFTVVAVLTLAVGIGANTAIFSAVNSVLLHPLPVAAIDRLVVVQENWPSMNLLGARLDPSETLDLTTNTGPFEVVAGVTPRNVVLTGQGEARRLSGVRTMGKFFDLFGLVPAAGRFYRPDESEGGRHRVAVLSYDFWQELGGKPSIVGSKLALNGDYHEVIGVAPRGFRYPRSTLLWMPYPVSEETRQNRGRLLMTTIGRLREGTGPAAVRPWLAQSGKRLHPDAEDSQRGLYFSSKSFLEENAGQLRPALLALFGAVGLVLLIACANVASLQLVHGAARTRELAVRSALGAERGTIVRQLLVENLVLSTIGGILGLGVALLILEVLAAAGGTELPALTDVRLDGRVLAFTAVATILSGLLFGMIPALRAGKVDLQRGLKDGARGQGMGVRHNRLLQTSVMVQVALTLVLLLGSALMIRTVSSLLEQDPGFRPEQVATMRVTGVGPRYAKANSLTPLYDAVLERVGATPGVTAVGMISDLPFTGGTDSSPFTIEGMVIDEKGPAPHANLLAVGGDYFKAMGIPVLRGRAFESGDVFGATRVAVIDERLAKQFFGAADPVGRQITHGGPTATIIGVVGTISHVELGENGKPTVYFPQRQRAWHSTMYVVVRSELGLGAVTGVVRNAAAMVDPGVPVFEPRLLTERISASLAPRRLTMTVLSGLAFVSLSLAVFGLYGVISYAVSQRTAEFGIRVALGAQPRHVRSMVVKQGVHLAIGGILIGLLAALGGTRALNALLYGVSSRDPAIFIGAAILLGVVAALASYLPARRATRVSPLEALRGD
jgi:putative ABC transport system permease protein